MPNAYRNGSIHTAIARAQAEYGGFTVLHTWGRGEWTVSDYFVLSGPRVGTYSSSGRWEGGPSDSFPALFDSSGVRILTEPARQKPYLLPGRVRLTMYNTAGVDLINRLLPYLGPMKEGIPEAQNSYAVVMSVIEKIQRAKRKARTYVGNSGPFSRPRELDEKRRQAKKLAPTRRHKARDFFDSNRKRRAPAKELLAYGQMEDDYLDDLAMYVIDQLDWRALFLFLLRTARWKTRGSSQIGRYGMMARDDHAIRRVLTDNIHLVLDVSETARSAIRNISDQLLLELYMLAEISGYGEARVLSDLYEQPKRYYAFLKPHPLWRKDGRKCPPSSTTPWPWKRCIMWSGPFYDNTLEDFGVSLDDRRRRARGFLANWSEKGAYRSLFPNIEGAASLVPDLIDAPGAKEIRDLLNYMASPKQVLVRAGLKDTMEDIRKGAQQGRFTGPEGEKQLRAEAQARLARDRDARVRAQREGMYALNRADRRLAQEGLRAQDRRYLIKKYDVDKLQRLADTLNQLSAIRELATEEREGRWALQHAEDKDWARLLQDHDWVARFYRENEERLAAIKDKAYILHHSQGRLFDTLGGVVRPLVLRREFSQEGREMNHCVAGYFPQRKSLVFAFLAPSGNRGTMELTMRGKVEQFHAESNRKVAADVQALGNAFLQANTQNGLIPRLRKEGTLLDPEQKAAMKRLTQRRRPQDDDDDDDW